MLGVTHGVTEPPDPETVAALVTGLADGGPIPEDDAAPPEAVDRVSASFAQVASAEMSFNRVLGTSGAETLKGTSGRDEISGFGGNDILYGFKRGDVLDGGAGDDEILGGNGADVLKGGTGNDVLKGGKGSDTLTGGAGRDVLKGGSRDDTLSGGNGNDELNGGSGGDHLYGGNDDDILDGGKGRDRMTGGAGADRFVIDVSAFDGDRVKDFSRAEGDVFDLGEVLPAGIEAEDLSSHVRFVASGDNALLQFSESGESGSFRSVAWVKNGAGLDAADLLNRGQIVLISPVLPNESPEPQDDTGFTAIVGTDLEIPVSTLLANDSDPDGDTLTVKAVSGARLDGSKVVFSPSSVGNTSFTYTAADPDGATASARVYVTVEAPPPPPPPPPPPALSFAGNDRAVVVDLEADKWAEAARILLLGDSITDGYGVDGGYRPYLWETLTQKSNLWVDFVGQYDNNPGSSFHDPDHQGKSGIHATEVLADINRIAQASPSDIALIMLGTNDVLREDDAGDTVPGELLRILERLHAANSDGLFLVAEILPVSDSTRFGTVNYRATDANEALPGIIAQARAQGIDARLVDTSAISLSDMYDGIHPSSGGQKKVASIWANAISNYATAIAGTLQADPDAVSGNLTDVVGSDHGDRLLGDNQGNELKGAGGNDWIEGRAGNDDLWGGSGIDQFVFDDTDGQDRIMDYASGSDLIYLRDGSTSSYSVSNQNGDAVISFGSTRITVENTVSSQLSIELIDSFVA
ncbi:GDSL-type esterase/lipase family protein [Tropicimonas aquimaris]|uniref:GDSL-type esterase/lipase family protein n=1 Tax=Tropicimonas aquimaris TaxID=914152 RepID=A0ABW3IL63_9RHOB